MDINLRLNDWGEPLMTPEEMTGLVYPNWTVEECARAVVRLRRGDDAD